MVCLDSSTVMTWESAVITFGVLVMTQGSLVFASVTTFRVWDSLCVCVCVCVCV